MFDMQKIGKKISSLRKEKGLTQMELADRMNFSYQAVSNWERGNTMPDISKLPELAEIFGVSIEELLCDERKGKLVEEISEDKVPTAATTTTAADIKAGFKTTTKISAKLRPFGALFFLPSNPIITRMISIYRPILCC